MSKENREKIIKMSDVEKLNYIVELLDKDIEMFTDCSDTHGIQFTNEYYEAQDKIEEFIKVVKSGQ